MPEIEDLLSDGSITDYVKGAAANNELLTKAEILALLPQHVSFSGGSEATITVSTDSANPSYFPLADLFVANDCTLFDAATGTVRNTSGRTVDTLSGTVSFIPDKTGVGTAILHLVTERSADNGVTWTGNLKSLEIFELQRDSNQFSTKLSILFDWLPNELIRFKAYSTGALDLVPPSDTIEGEVYTGYSFFWSMVELLD